MRWFVAPLVLALVACGGRESVASKSAAAYREAQAKGIPVAGGHEHGGHAATGTTTEPAAHTDHSAHGTMAAEDHAAMGHATTDHAAAGHAGTAHAAMGHAATGGASTSHAGMGHAAMNDPKMNHSKMDHSTPSSSTSHASGTHAGMDHSTTPGSSHSAHAAGQSSTDAHRQHSSTGQSPSHAQHTTPQQTSGQAGHAGHGAVPPASGSASSLERGLSLEQDAFDAPSETAVSEARKAAQGGGGHEGHQTRGITPGEDDENPPTPMPATRDRTSMPGSASTDHGEHAAAVYTCPMHPEVISDKPGTCPKCGMALVKKN